MREGAQGSFGNRKEVMEEEDEDENEEEESDAEVEESNPPFGKLNK